MDMAYLLGADIGTTSLKACVFNEAGECIRSATKDYTLAVSGDRVEFPAEDYFKLFSEAFEEVSAGLEIAALAIDTQCETLILADEAGRPLMPAIVWLDNRAAKEAEEIKAQFGNKLVYEVTGQPEITATWPASKLLWVKKNCPEIYAKIGKVFLLEDYLLWRLSGRFVTQKTLQSSSLYYDIQKDCWWQEMLDFIGVDAAWLPELLDSGKKIGEYQGVAVVTSAMDQVAGAIGAGVTDGSAVSEMTGTTMVVFAPCEGVPAYDPQSIVPCHKNFDGKFCRLAWTSTAGIALKWFKNNFCEQFSFRELDDMAAAIPAGSAGLTFLPYLCGSTMPKYDPDARGAFLGLTMEHTRAHAVRSVLESVACMLKANLDYLGIEAKEIRSMGGGASSPLWCQIKADMVGKTISTLENNETACLGSAILAGVGAGLFADAGETAKKMVKIKKSYIPSGTDYAECYQNYCNAEEKLLG
jgi:xylulokinase